MDDSNCAVCDANIPDHFLKRGLSQCPTCIAIRTSLAESLKPQSKSKIHSADCKLCGGKIPSNFSHPLCDQCVNCLTAETGISENIFFENDGRPWLVRCDGRVFGPLSTDEVVSKIRAKEVGLFDQISQPFEEWRYVREEEIFRDIVGELKNNFSLKEDTASLENTIVIETTTVTDVDLLEPVSTTTQTYEIRSTRSSILKVLAFLGGALVAVSIFLFVVRPPWLASFQKGSREFGEYLRDAKQAQVVGDFDKAIVNYKEAYAIRDDDADVAFNLAALYIDGQQTVLASRIIEKFNGRQPFEKFYLEFHVLNGLIALISENADKAKDEIKMALDSNKQSVVAILDLASAHSMKAEYKDAYELLTTQFDENESQPIGLLLLAESVVNEKKLFDDPKITSDVLQKFNNFSKRSSEYFQEIGVARILFNLKIGKKAEAKEVMEQILDSDPDESILHLQDPLLFRDHVRWGRLLTWCKDIGESLGDKPLVTAFLGLCTLKSGDVLTGRNFIENAVKKSQEDTLAQALYSYAQGILGLSDLSEAALKAAQTKDGTKILPILLNARKCVEKKDMICAASEWNRILDINPKSLAAFAGLAELALAQKRFPIAHENIQKGFQVSTNYQPLLKLQIEYEKVKQ